MNEEIIVDGVNVKDCRRRVGKENFCRYYKRGCADNNYNCIWKKCLRLEQENKALVEENEDMKEMYRLSCLKCEYKNTKVDVDKYHKALEEIRSYVNAQLDGFGNDVYGITKNQITTITDKINEVLR